VGEQRIMNGSYRTIQRVCDAHRSCWTVRGALHKMALTPSDLTPDLNHLSVTGLAEMAACAWRAMPRAIKNRD
jgi:hypothetical protein